MNTAATMNTFVRWCVFNAVGAVGMVVQLGVLAMLNRLVPGHYLIATAAAIEITLLFNFALHLRTTWRDRHDNAVLRPLVRFHVSNGMVSLVGNLALMRMLVGGARLPMLVANGVAIVCCSCLNFGLSHVWAFAGSTQTG